MTERSVTHSTSVIERVYDAPQSRVFDALSDPALTRQLTLPGLAAATDGRSTS